MRAVTRLQCLCWPRALVSKGSVPDDLEGPKAHFSKGSIPYNSIDPGGHADDDAWPTHSSMSQKCDTYKLID